MGELKTIELNRLSATRAAQLLARREMSAEQLLLACFARIEQREGVVRAWTTLDKEAALRQARQLDGSTIQGVLHGLPFGVKDIFATGELPTRYGSPIYDNHRPIADAAAVALCRDAGALVLGKTVTTEFASYQPGPTRNPHNLAYSPGGSSSGSAAAVADHMVPFALGTQTAGSIVRPAAYCGVVGYKPSYGSIQRAGLKTIADSLDTIGGFARTIDDVALFASVLMRDTALRELEYDAKPRIGMYRTLQWGHAEHATRDAYAHAASALSRAGAKVNDLELPAALCALVQAHADIMSVEMAQSLAFEHTRHRGQLSSSLQALLDVGVQISAKEHRANLQLVQDRQISVQRWFDDYDILLAPSAGGEAPLFEQGTGDPLFCRVWTVFGMPCVHLPFFTGPQGLPMGLQVVGRRGDDRRVLAMGKWVLNVLRPNIVD